MSAPLSRYTLFPLALLLATALAAAAPPSAWARCQGVVNGPCASPEPAAFLPGPPDLVVTNFGLLFPGSAPAEWQLVCDDNFGVAPAPRLRRAPDGQLFAPSDVGLYRSTDGCEWTTAGGALVAPVFDVAFSPGRVWALARIPRALYRSDDGGASFTQVYAFDQDPQPFTRLVVAPDGLRLSLFGRDSARKTPAALSLDGGVTFTQFDLSARATTPPATALDFLAVDPDDPLRLYFSVLQTQGDQLWVSRDGAMTVAPLLNLQAGDALTGFTFGGAASAGDPQRTLYVAATDLFPASGGAPTARLYRSRDGGATWLPPVVSAPRGPRYRCLAHAGGRLYACGVGEPLGDEFLVGVSSDEGETWQPVARLADLSGARACVKASCLRTEAWLCQSYGQCAPGQTPGGPDAGIDAPADGAEPGPDASGCVGTACVEQQGCSCDLTSLGARPSFPAWLLLLAPLGWLRICRQPRSRALNQPINR